LPASSLELWDVIADEAAAESPLWGEALLPSAERELEAVFSPLLAQPRYAVGLETIYEGYLLHYGRPRLFESADADTALLLGDYLYAHGLVRVAHAGPVEAVSDLAALISKRLLLVIATVILLGFLLLMIAFRSVLVPLQAAITNVLPRRRSSGRARSRRCWSSEAWSPPTRSTRSSPTTRTTSGRRTAPG